MNILRFSVADQTACVCARLSPSLSVLRLADLAGHCTLPITTMVVEVELVHEMIVPREVT
jgi:hypothetical protein